MSRRSLRMIFPDLVLGRSSAQMIRLGRASLPIWRPTCSRSLVSRSASGTTPEPRVTYATIAWPVRSLVAGQPGRAGGQDDHDLAVPWAQPQGAGADRHDAFRSAQAGETDLRAGLTPSRH